MKKSLTLIVLLTTLSASPLVAQHNDYDTPLHLLLPDYPIAYRVVTTAQVKSDIDRVLHYLTESTPIGIVDSATGDTLTDYEHLPATSRLRPTTFRLTSYEWGVTYSAMMTAAEITGDNSYRDYATSRLLFLAHIAPHFKTLLGTYGEVDPQMQQMVAPAALDDAGAMCTAMIKAFRHDPSPELRRQIDSYMDYILNHQYRLPDGTFARNRPQRNTLWLDDMFMGIPPLAYYSLIADPTSDYLSQAIEQVRLFTKRMWVPEEGLFRHGWVESMSSHPAFYWARANGWALLSLCHLLDVMPPTAEARQEIIDLLQAHIQSLAALQSGEGLWHQLINRADSYLETSATAIFVYCIAHAINEGWIDARAFGPVAHLGWQAVASKINDRGQVTDVCVGTGMAFDPMFYYYRPTNVYAAHGYGPVIMAGAEMMRLIEKYHPTINDSAIQFYPEGIPSDKAIFEVGE